MATKTMDSEIDPSAPGEGKGNDPTSKIASLRERLMRALAEIEDTRRLGERRAEDAGQYAITNFACELLQVVDNLRRAIAAAEGDALSRNSEGLLEGVAATDRILTQILNRFGVQEIKALNEPFDPKKARSGDGSGYQRTAARQCHRGHRERLHASRPPAAARAGRRGQIASATVASGATMMPHSLGGAEAQTGVGIGRRSLHDTGRKKGSYARRNPEGLSPTGEKAAPGSQPRQQDG
ncbi:hypothetical protein M2175_003979 [Bradyrhizobium elkanii]|nr:MULTISPECIES: nucleotide exchange factor GrpE [Bradyrhizobium]MCS3928948.1 hypothetical protein [Bradyrhizobium elkanii]MCS3969504.1 hypothetical protein [Bradyrhizobium japonicum]